MIEQALSLGWLPVIAVVACTFCKIRVLAWVRPLSDLPSLTIIIAARNEARALQNTIPQLLAQDYPDLKIIVVDDRSHDDTPSVLAQYPQITAIRVDHLPENWLGKCHALHVGSLKNNADWILFLDADVDLAPQAAKKAVSAAIKRNLDHLPCSPRLILKSAWEQLFIVYFHIAFGFRYLPGHVGGKDPRIHVGTGAFNLIRREVYQKIGGHQALRLEVVDDMELGRRVKLAGYRQAFFAAYETVQVRWFEGLRGLLKGLEKNAFAAQGYNILLSSIGVILTLAVSLAPLHLMIQKDPAGWVPYLIVTAFCLRNRPCVGHAAWACFLWPVGGLLTAATLAYSMISTLQGGGVKWRDTFYSLKQLRAGRAENAGPSFPANEGQPQSTTK